MDTLDQVAQLKPQTIEEALEAMKLGLRYFHDKNDFRATFLRAYYIITKNVGNAIRQQEDFSNPIFFDPEWIRKLSGKFASLYFASLTSAQGRGESHARAWKVAHGMAAEKKSSVVQDLLLGINAHINYDLPIALCENLAEHKDEFQSRVLTRRKFDHDQVNNILIRSFDEISTVIPQNYGGAIKVADSLLCNIDESLTRLGLRVYRERVWWDAVALLSANSEGERQLVMDKLNWQSGRLAKTIAGETSRRIKWGNRVLRLFRKSNLGNVNVG